MDEQNVEATSKYCKTTKSIFRNTNFFILVFTFAFMPACCIIMYNNNRSYDLNLGYEKIVKHTFFALLVTMVLTVLGALCDAYDRLIYFILHFTVGVISSAFNIFIVIEFLQHSYAIGAALIFMTILNVIGLAGGGLLMINLRQRE
nr:hypothetical transcript [Hymenolepis microstoma]